jgi:hypothetical protein
MLLGKVIFDQMRFNWCGAYYHLMASAAGRNKAAADRLP